MKIDLFSDENEKETGGDPRQGGNENIISSHVSLSKLITPKSNNKTLSFINIIQMID